MDAITVRENNLKAYCTRTRRASSACKRL